MSVDQFNEKAARLRRELAAIGVILDARFEAAAIRASLKAFLAGSKMTPDAYRALVVMHCRPAKEGEAMPHEDMIRHAEAQSRGVKQPEKGPVLLHETALGGNPRFTAASHPEDLSD